MFFSTIIKRLGGYNGLRNRYLQTNNRWMQKWFLFLNQGFQHETNAYLPFDFQCAGPIYFVHGVYGVFISGGAKIGKNCAVFQQVTIGSNMLLDSKGFGSPQIGDNCLIGAGAKVIGNVKIGNNCRIGANAVVTVDMPDNSVCVAGKPVIIQKENLVNHIYSKSVNGWGYHLDGVFVLEKDPEKLAHLNQK